MLVLLALVCMAGGGLAVLLAGESQALFVAGCAALAAVPWLLWFELRRHRRETTPPPPPDSPPVA